ncbi:MAG: aryl-sulfate sulfotransferase, partial [Candidatus Thermoplasmatota archaeon]|nr:aryl-sulfate sulfotransferase [Candidatus Thermoplasmatota archaeon]
MKIRKYYGSVTFVIIFLLCLTCFTPLSLTQTFNQNNLYDILFSEDQILFAPMYSTKTYLINKNGDVTHTWSSNYFPGESVYMLENGTVLRSIKMTLSGGGVGGGVQKISWDNTLLWDYKFYSDTYVSTHDIEPLPNGNVLILAWEEKSRNEAIAAGRNPNTILDSIKSNFIVEVKPTGLTTGDIVWQWHVWDHLIQDYNPSKANYGIVKNHPELININFGSSSTGTDQSDWLHCNSIDYNPVFDQILISVRHFSEIWVIDHSTTTEEAAGHTGGKSGKGGDLLYRWGNPRAYKRGTSSDRKLFEQHDATWIKQGYPGEGHILVFNNGNNRPGVEYTSIDEIVPPVDGNGNYFIENGSAYGPKEQIYIYNTSFFANYIGGAQRLKNGNTVICNGPEGKFLEVTPNNEIIWQYTNPFPNLFVNDVFKIDYISVENHSPDTPDLDCDGNLIWTNVLCKSIVNGSFSIKNIGGNASVLNWKIESYPSWGTWSFS